MMGRLAAIAAILRTAAGLDAEKPAELHLVGIEMPAVDGLRLKQQVIEGGLIKRERRFPAPVPVDFTLYRRHRSRLVRMRCKRHIPLRNDHLAAARPNDAAYARSEAR